MRMTTGSLAALAAGLCLLGWAGTVAGETTSPEARHATQGAGDDAAFILVVGADTFGVETFSRTPRAITGEIVGRQIGRLSYTATLAPDALITRWEMSAWLPGAAADAPPVQEADFAFRGDSVIVDISAAGATQTQRFQTEAGALPTYPTSIVLLEQAVRRARVIGGDTVEIPLFTIAGGMTTSAAVARLGQDSVTITVGFSQVRLRVDDEGRILGGTIPAQNLTIHRVARGAGEAAAKGAGEEVKRDYSAPPDAPYTAEEVTVPVPGAASPTHTLAGTLTIPKGRTGTVPAVVTISGSGAQHRDSDILPGYAPFREIADYLGHRGIAVLRLDDRGTGASTGNFATATSADFADDIRAALAFLRARPEIDPGRLVLLGHSEGGIVAPMVAATDTALAAIALLAAPAQTGREVIRYQFRNLISADSTLRDAARDSALASAIDGIESRAASDPWIRFFLDYDPLPTAAQVRQPVLILHGATDRQVTADQAEQLAAAIRGGGNPDVEVHIFPDINHLFVFDPDGHPPGYAALPSKRVAPVVLSTLAEWLEGELRR